MATKEGWIKRKLNGNGIPWNKGKRVPQITGENNTRWSRVTKSCLTCSKDFTIRKYRQTTANYCSRDCADRGKLLPEEVVNYHSLHKWVYSHLGSPNRCSNCGFESDNNRQFHWSNIDHKYKRDLGDWQRLCVKCHRKYDEELRRNLVVA